jgi:peptidoglycan-associated lipoprotein
MSRSTIVPVRKLTLIFVLGLASACASTPLPAVREAILTRPTPAPLPAARPSSDANRSIVAIAPSIRAACGISDSEAFFPYDSAAVRPEDRAILRKLADCFATGPLKTKRMRLVGHADPRGDEEYNYLLGQRRADNVKFGITSSGMVGERVATTSRGEDDAKGLSEAGWAKDRRVDVMLGN